MRETLRNRLLYLLTAVASFFFGLFVLDQIILPQLAGGKMLVEVPALEGFSLSQARKLCREAGLLLTIRGETYNDDKPAESILKQEPDPGIVVKQGRKVFVLVSLGPEGAVLVTSRGAWHAREPRRARVVHTVGCGDALLAGFLSACACGRGPARERHVRKARGV